MNAMSLDIRAICVPILSDLAGVRRTELQRQPYLIGSGIVVSPTAVITCRHVIEKALGPVDVEAPNCFGIAVKVGGDIQPVTEMLLSSTLDLCCLRIAKPVPTDPVRLCRAEQLEGYALSTIGFVEEVMGPQQNSIHNLRAIQNQQFGDLIQATQLEGGFPRGFSGGPVLADGQDGWSVVGMLYLGREEAATSRMIAIDPIATFLSTLGVEVEVGSLPRKSVSTHRVKGQAVHVDGSVSDSDFLLKGRGVDQAVDVGGDVTRTVIRLKNQED